MSENYETKLIGIQNGRNFRELGAIKPYLVKPSNIINCLEPEI